MQQLSALTKKFYHHFTKFQHTKFSPNPLNQFNCMFLYFIYFIFSNVDGEQNKEHLFAELEEVKRGNSL